MTSPETIEFYQRRWAILDRSPFLKAFLDQRMLEDEGLWGTVLEEHGRPLSRRIGKICNGYGIFTIKPLAMNGDLHQVFAEGLDEDDKMGFVTTIFFIGFEVGDWEDSSLFINDLRLRLVLNGAFDQSQVTNPIRAENTKATILSWLAAGTIYRNLEDEKQVGKIEPPVAVSPELRRAINDIPALDSLGN